MKRLLHLVALILLWASAASGSGIWVQYPGSSYSFLKTSTTQADAFLTGTGLVTIFPGGEALTLPGYRPGVGWLWQRYDGYRIVGVPFEAWPGGVLRFRADSTGASVTGKMVVSDSLRSQRGLFGDSLRAALGLFSDSLRARKLLVQDSLRTPQVMATNAIVSRLGPASGPTFGGAIRIVDGPTFPPTGAGLQYALDEVDRIGKGTVWVMADTILCDSTVWLHSGTTLRGLGMGQTILKRSRFSASDPANSGHVVVSAKHLTHTPNAAVSGGLPTDSLSNIEVSDLTIDGNYTAWPGVDPNTPGNMGIQLWFVDGVLIQNVEVKNTLQTGIELDACRNARITGWKSEHTGQQTNAGSRNGINLNNNSGSLNASANWARGLIVDHFIVRNQKGAAVALANVSDVSITDGLIVNDAITPDGVDGNYGIENEGSLVGYIQRRVLIRGIAARGIGAQFYRLSLSNGVGANELTISDCTARFGPSSFGGQGGLFFGRTNDNYIKHLRVSNVTLDSINVGRQSDAPYLLLGMNGAEASEDLVFENVLLSGADTTDTGARGAEVYGHIYGLALDHVTVRNSGDVGFWIRNDTSRGQRIDNVLVTNCMSDRSRQKALIIGASAGGANTTSGVVVRGFVAKDAMLDNSDRSCQVQANAGETVVGVQLDGLKIVRSAAPLPSFYFMQGLRIIQNGGTLDSVRVMNSDLLSATGTTFQVSGTVTNLSYDDPSLPFTFANLGSPVNGTSLYCSDCTKATPCASGGSGALAVRINGAWDCNP